MGQWGIKALESDDGMDMLDFLEENYLSEHTVLALGDMLDLLTEEGFLGESFEEVDYLYDNTALALAELYVEWQETGMLNHDGEETQLWSLVTAFTDSPEAIDNLLHRLTDVRKEVPDENGERELVELWKESDSWDAWSKHLDSLIQKLEQYREK